MTKPAAKYDVWFLAADQVYSGVPAEVVTGWAEQGRLGADDRVRPTGKPGAWQRVRETLAIAMFLYSPPTTEAAAGELPAEYGPPVELDAVTARNKRFDEDDEVDMIPLIDVSLVLLVFFMLTTVVSKMSPIDVPEMRGAETLTKEANSLTVQIDRRTGGEKFYALRVGDAAPTLEDANLATVAEVMARLDAKLGTLTEPPEVRIACHKLLPRGAVREVTVELDKRQKKNQIRSYTADVSQAAEGPS